MWLISKKDLISEVLLNHLTWRPGRSAEALRSGATITLYTSLTLNIPKDITKLVPVVLSLIEDAAPRTRSLSLKSLSEISTRLVAQPDDFSKTVQGNIFVLIKSYFLEYGPTFIPGGLVVISLEDTISPWLKL